MSGVPEGRSLVVNAFRWMREEGFAKQNFVWRATLIRGALADPSRSASRGAAAGLLTLYAALLALAPTLYVLEQAW